jgi:hemoglobin-like flavoprotein
LGCVPIEKSVEEKLMTLSQADLVQSSFARVVPIAEQAAALFYSRLFELDPSLRPLFRGDLKEQGKKLMDSLRLVVANVKNLDRIIPGIRALGQRHVAYGVRDEHYDTVGAALLWTLEQGLGEHFTPQVRQAWAMAYDALATSMKDAAAEVEQVA